MEPGPFAGTSESSDHFLKEFMEEIQPEAKNLGLEVSQMM